MKRKAVPRAGRKAPAAHLVAAMAISRTTQDSARIGGALAGAGFMARLGLASADGVIVALYLAGMVLTLRSGGAQAASQRHPRCTTTGSARQRTCMPAPQSDHRPHHPHHLQCTQQPKQARKPCPARPRPGATSAAVCQLRLGRGDVALAIANDVFTRLDGELAERPAHKTIALRRISQRVLDDLGDARAVPDALRVAPRRLAPLIPGKAIPIQGIRPLTASTIRSDIRRLGEKG